MEPLKMIKIYKTDEEFRGGPLGKYVWFGAIMAHNEIRYKKSQKVNHFIRFELKDGTVKSDQDL